MEVTFTPEDLIRYIYKETTAEETVLIEQEIRSDFSLKEMHDELLGSVTKLDEAIVAPSPNSVQAILKYSKNVAPMETSF